MYKNILFGFKYELEKNAWRFPAGVGLGGAGLGAIYGYGSSKNKKELKKLNDALKTAVLGGLVGSGVGLGWSKLTADAAKQATKEISKETRKFRKAVRHIKNRIGG